MTQKTINIALFFWDHNGKGASTSVRDEIIVQKGDHFPVKLVPIDANTLNEEEIQKIISQTIMIIAVLTENCLAQQNYVRALELAVLENSKIMLLHDQASCRFPGETEQPDSLLMAGVFKDKAVTFMENYGWNVVEQILKKFQRYLDSKKTHDFLILQKGPLQPEEVWPSERDKQMWQNFLPGVNYRMYPVYQDFVEKDQPEIPAESDAQSRVFRMPTDEEKANIEELVRTSHAVVYIPQGRRGPKLATVSRTELYIYEMAIKHNSRVYIMDQHGVYAPLISRFCTRYGLDSNKYLKYVQTLLPTHGFGTSLIVKEKRLGGCKSLATSTRAFLSHKRSSGQGIAGRIWEGLKDDYSVFLDSEADFDLHDLGKIRLNESNSTEVIVERTENFILLLTEGILQSYWCLQEIRSAIRNKKKFIVIRDYTFQLPKVEDFPSDMHEVAQVIHSSKTFVYMAEFYLPFMQELKKEIGVPDVQRMLSETQLQCSSNAEREKNFLEVLKSGKHPLPLKIRVIPDATIQELKNIDLLKYIEGQGYHLSDVESVDRNIIQTYEEALEIGDKCPNLKEKVQLNGLISDIELMLLFDGNRFKNLETLAVGDRREPILLATSLGLSVVLKNLPNLKVLTLGRPNPDRADPSWYDWLAKADGLKTLVCYDPNYVPEPGKNAPLNAKIVLPNAPQQQKS